MANCAVLPRTEAAGKGFVETLPRDGNFAEGRAALGNNVTIASAASVSASAVRRMPSSRARQSALAAMRVIGSSPKYDVLRLA